jgi:hypothetical protein
MALGDKKSGLQPSSVQAQQYRLQFSNLESRAASTITGGQVAQPTSRPAVSTLAPPAAVVTPAPVPPPAVAQTPAVIPSTFRKAAFFNGATILSASLSTGNDFGFNIDQFNSTNRVQIDLIFKPASLEGSTRRTIFHTYSGSAMSQSLELYMIGPTLYLEMTNNTTTVNGQVVPDNWYTSTDLNWARAFGLAEYMNNQYTFYSARLAPGAYNSVELKLKGQTMSYGGVGNLALFGRQINVDFDISNNTHFYIGGSVGRNSYFSGSIASIMFTSGSYISNQQWGDVALRDTPQQTITPQLRTYTFDNAPVEITGSQARYSRPLQTVTGTLTYVDGYLKR